MEKTLKSFDFLKSLRRMDWVKLILMTIASLSIVIVLLIALFTISESIPAFSSLGLDLLLGDRWAPYYGRYGATPLVYGSLIVVFGAVLIAVPLGVLSAISLAEYMPRKLGEVVKPMIELLAAIPSIIYGFLGMVFIAPTITKLFGISLGRTALTASIVLSMMITPTIVSISSEVISSVPREYRMAAIALGATKWQVIRGVVIPTALPGIVASILLAFGRAVGETVAVLMSCGCVAKIPSPPWNLLDPVHTLTAAIALDMGEVAMGSMHYHVLFGLGVILFVITFSVNTAAWLLMRRAPRRLIKV